jgi:hypothetical protein
MGLHITIRTPRYVTPVDNIHIAKNKLAWYENMRKSNTVAWSDIISRVTGRRKEWEKEKSNLVSEREKLFSNARWDWQTEPDIYETQSIKMYFEHATTVANTCQAAKAAYARDAISEAPLTIFCRESRGMQVLDCTALLCVTSAWIISQEETRFLRIWTNLSTFRVQTALLAWQYGLSNSSLQRLHIRESQVLISARLVSWLIILRCSPPKISTFISVDIKDSCISTNIGCLH